MGLPYLNRDAFMQKHSLYKFKALDLSNFISPVANEIAFRLDG